MGPARPRRQIAAAYKDVTKEHAKQGTIKGQTRHTSEKSWLVCQAILISQHGRVKDTSLAATISSLPWGPMTGQTFVKTIWCHTETGAMSGAHNVRSQLRAPIERKSRDLTKGPSWFCREHLSICVVWTLRFVEIGRYGAVIFVGESGWVVDLCIRRDVY
jgi:hypothetical protein